MADGFRRQRRCKVILIRRLIRFSIIPIRLDVRFVLAFTILLLPLAVRAYLRRSTRKIGPDCWEYLWRDANFRGRIVRHKTIVGTR
jgi:hypothetical protein